MYHVGHGISIRQRSILTRVFLLSFAIWGRRLHRFLLCYSVTDRYARSAHKFLHAMKPDKTFNFISRDFQSLVVGEVILRGEALAERRNETKKKKQN